MNQTLHQFHIPVMGTGHSADTPLRLAPLGITSVMSLVDDLLLERLRRHYSARHGRPYAEIGRHEPDGRARRVTAWLDLVADLVAERMEAVRRLPFFEANDKARYFSLLPDVSPLKAAHRALMAMPAGPARDTAADALARRMEPGAADVNIMVKLDRMPYDRFGRPQGDLFTDAKAALRGVAESRLNAAVVFSAGLNPRLFSYLGTLDAFHAGADGRAAKRIIVKVGDVRSALVQGRFLAKHGLAVAEYRVESGLNCGGHAFPSDGRLVPSILADFRARWSELTADIEAVFAAARRRLGRPAVPMGEPLLTVQGGIGVAGEAERLRRDYGVARTGWGSPFLLVPEATNVDDETRDLLARSGEADFYLSDKSPLGVPFNVVRGTSSERWTAARAAAGRPGSACPNGFAVTNTEFSERPVCVASRFYQKKKTDEIDARGLPPAEAARLKAEVAEKTCICYHLGNGVLEKVGAIAPGSAPAMICPGPNLAWFDRTYSLEEMVDHIYGRGRALTPARRPHMFAKELMMNVEYLEKRVALGLGRAAAEFRAFRENLERGMADLLTVARSAPLLHENLASIVEAVAAARERLARLTAVEPCPA